MPTHGKPPDASPVPPSQPGPARDGSSPPAAVRPPWGETPAEHRAYCWRLRHSLGLAVEQIAAHVGKSRSTVTRWLQKERRRLARELEPGGRFSAAETIAAAVDKCERVEMAALQNFHGERTTTRDRMLCLRVVLMAQAQKLDVLQRAGLLPNDFGTLRLENGREHFRATEIRKLAEELRSRGALPAGPPDADDDLVPIGEKRFLYGDAAVIDAEIADEDDDHA